MFLEHLVHMCVCAYAFSQENVHLLIYDTGFTLSNNKNHCLFFNLKAWIYVYSKPNITLITFYTHIYIANTYHLVYIYIKPLSLFNPYQKFTKNYTFTNVGLLFSVVKFLLGISLLIITYLRLEIDLFIDYKIIPHFTLLFFFLSLCMHLYCSVIFLIQSSQNELPALQFSV